MRRIKKILFVIVAIMLILPSFHITAATTNSKQDEKNYEERGKISSKDEVVYGNLSATGNSEEIYVVNTFNVTKEGKIVDFGPYTSIKNLTDLSDIEQINQKVQFTASEGEFYYQGNMVGVSLPWNINISYFLDGKEISPEELAGKDGKVRIQIDISANEKANPLFFENYLLQISLPLDSNVFANIKAEDGMIANAGKNKQVTFTVMPEQEKEFVLEADAVGFELEGIDISGIPSTMSIDSPDVDEMTDDIKTLSDAISEVNDGVAELNNGVSELNNGVADLHDGSKQYQNGILELDETSTELVNGSQGINEALEMMSNSLEDVQEIDLREMEQLVEGLSGIANGLRKTAKGLTDLKDGYNQAYSVLYQAMESIPSYKLTDQEIGALYASGADEETLNKLLETYKQAQTAKGVFSDEDLQKAFNLVAPSLETSIGAMTNMANTLDTMANEVSSSLENIDIMDGITQLQEGIEVLSSEYKTFHSGLVEYTKGVGQLSSSYQDMHNGIGDLSSGTKDLENGVGELYDGTKKLHDQTSDLPEQMTDEIDQMISDYDKSDFDAISFVSEKNKNVNIVQFVLKTKSIKYEKPETTEESGKEEKGFWARLLDLFR